MLCPPPAIYSFNPFVWGYGELFWVFQCFLFEGSIYTRRYIFVVFSTKDHLDIVLHLLSHASIWSSNNNRLFCVGLWVCPLTVCLPLVTACCLQSVQKWAKQTVKNLLSNITIFSSRVWNDTYSPRVIRFCSVCEAFSRLQASILHHRMTAFILIHLIQKKRLEELTGSRWGHRWETVYDITKLGMYWWDVFKVKFLNMGWGSLRITLMSQYLDST